MSGGESHSAVSNSKCLLRVIRDGAGPAVSPAMSLMPPEAEVNSEH